MVEFAQFVALSATDARFAASGRGFTYDLTGINRDRNVVVMFKVSGPNNARLQMSAIQSTGAPRIIDFVLDSTFASPRSWHEIVGGALFQASDNRLVVEGNAGDGGGFANVSDLVILYHATAGNVGVIM